MSVRVKSHDPVFNIHFSYINMNGAKITYLKSVRAPDELNARIWVQQVIARDCKVFIEMKIYESAVLKDNPTIPHIYDLGDDNPDLLDSIKSPLLTGINPPSYSTVKDQKKEIQLKDLPWAEAYHLWPGRGLGTTKTSLQESFYDAAEGAFEND